MATFSTTNPTTVSEPTKKSDYDKVFENTLALREQLVDLTTLSDGELYIGDSGGVPVINTVTEGYGINITNAAGSITIAKEKAQMLNEPEEGNAYSAGATAAWYDLVTHRIYVSKNSTTITGICRYKRDVGGADSCKFRFYVAGSYSNEVVSTSTAWAWSSIMTMNIATTGWTTMIIQTYEQANSTMHLQGYSFYG